MKKTMTLAAAAFSITIASAAVPLRWTVETSRVQPVVFDVVRGETVDLEAVFQNAGKPFSMDVHGDCRIFWQTNGMASAWWTAPAVASSNRVSAVFTPGMDPGAAAVIGFLGATGQIYRAAFQLLFRHGPGAIPNELPLPQKVIDFSRITVLNPPWSGGGGGGVDTNAVDTLIAEYDRTNLVARFAGTLREAKDYADSLPPYVPKADDPAFSNAVLSVGIDTNALAAVAASTNAVAQIGEFYSAFSDIGLTPAQGGMTLAGLLAALVAAVTWLRKSKISLSGDSAEMTGYLGLLKAHEIEVCDEHSASMNIAFSGGRHSFSIPDGGFAFRSLDSVSELSPDGTPIATMGIVWSMIGDVNAVLEAALDGSDLNGTEVG